MALVIDNHIHLISGRGDKHYLPTNYRWSLCVNWAYRGGPPYERDPMDLYPRQEERVADPDGSATVAAMERAGVDAGVLIHADFGPGHGETQELSMEEMHQDYANLQKKYPGKLYAFAGPDVRRPGSLELVEKAFRDWDTKGLKVFPENGYFVNDPMLYPFYQKCLEYERPIAICTNFEPPFSRGRFNDPIYITDVVADFPDLNVIIFHCGNPFEHWFDISLAIGGAALNTYLEFDAWIHPGRRPEEEMVRRLAKARDRVGAHRIIFGTDFQCAPTNWGERRAEDYVKHVGWWKELPKTALKYGVNFSQEEVDLMMGLNLGRLLGVVDMPEYTKKRKYGWSILMPRPMPTP